MSDEIQKLGMPKWGLSMTEGRLLEWLVEEGAEIAEGEEVAEVETDKLAGAVESPVAGTLRRRVAAVGEVVPVGGLLGVLAAGSVGDDDVDAYVATFQAAFVPGEEEDEGPQPETASVGATTLRFLRQGDGDEAVVLLHGFGGDMQNWMFTAPHWPRAARCTRSTCRATAARPRTRGRVTSTRWPTPCWAFLDAQEIERAHLVGHSLGGLVAVSVALRAPDRVASLALIATVGLGEEINQEYIDGFVQAESRRELKPVLQLLFADPDQVTRQLVDDVLKYKRLDGVDAALRAIAGSAFQDGVQRAQVADELAGLDLPVLVLWGSEDKIIPAAHAERAPDGATVAVLDGAGHSPHMENAGEVNERLEQFLQSDGR